MDSRQLMVIAGLSLVLSMLLSPAIEQAFADHRNDRTRPISRGSDSLPPMGAVYVISLSGDGHAPRGNIVKPISAYLELKVTQLKTTGIKTAFLTLVKGDLKVGDDSYSLTDGLTTIIAATKQLNIKASSKDGRQVLTAFAALADSLPVSTSKDPAKLVQGKDRKSASIQVGAEKWFMDFTGDISRIA